MLKRIYISGLAVLALSCGAVASGQSVNVSGAAKAAVHKEALQSANRAAATCGERWENYYWARKLPIEQIQVGCMGDGQLMVAPKVGTINESLYQYHGGLPLTDIRRPRVEDLKATPFDFNYYTDANMGPLDTRGVAFQHSNVIPFPIKGTNLAVITRQGFSFCAVEKSLLNKKVWPVASPRVCGVVEKDRFKITSIRFSIDRKTSILVRIHQGLPVEVQPSELSNMIFDFINTTRRK